MLKNKKKLQPFEYIFKEKIPQVNILILLSNDRKSQLKINHSKRAK